MMGCDSRHAKIKHKFKFCGPYQVLCVYFVSVIQTTPNFKCHVYINHSPRIYSLSNSKVSFLYIKYSLFCSNFKYIFPVFINWSFQLNSIINDHVHTWVSTNVIERMEFKPANQNNPQQKQTLIPSNINDSFISSFISSLSSEMNGSLFIWTFEQDSPACIKADVWHYIKHSCINSHKHSFMSWFYLNNAPATL